ncbi:cytochrome P450, partial [Mycena metata]
VFALLELARAQGFQEELRRELHTAMDHGTSAIAYDSMSLLNALIKETLRMYPAEALAPRIALQDTALPTGGVKTLAGDQVFHIPVRKGQLVTLGIASYQQFAIASLWGPDAQEFKPSRWLQEVHRTGEAVGPYANLF